MIPMSCPSCGRRGTVPPDRLNTRMHCKKCDAVFHMDRSGKIVLGDPNDAGRKKTGGGGTMTKEAKAKAKEKAKARSKAQRSSEPSGEGLAGMISGLPGPVKLGVVVGALLLILAVTLGPTIRKMFVGSKVPKGIDARTNFVGDRFAYGDLGSILKTAEPGTEDALRQWYDKVKPMFKFEGPKQQGNIVIPQPLSVTNAGGVSEICIRITSPRSQELPEVAEAKKTYEKTSKPPLVAGYNPDGTFDLPTSWLQKGDGEAYLDGTKSLELLTNPPKGDAGKKK